MSNGPVAVQKDGMTRAERINARRGSVITLPIMGEEIIVRKAGLMHMIALGTLPDTLSDIVSQVIKEAEEGTATAEEGLKLAEDKINGMPKAEQLQFITEMYNATLKACGVDPRFVEVVKDERSEVSVHDVEMPDKEYVFNWAQGGNLADFKATFPTLTDQQVGNVDNLVQGDEVRPATVSASTRRSRRATSAG